VSEADIVARTPGLPPTIDSLAADLAVLGVKRGAAIIVHASLSSIGWVVGGAPAVIAALTRALGPDGTLMMPTHTRDLTDPAVWRRPPVPPDWVPVITAHMPAFDAATTPTRGMGAIAESFRTHPGTRRSRHPHVSFAARGPQASFLVDDHAYDHAMGERSPLARLYDIDGWVLLLGVGHGVNTSLHLAEHRCDWPGKHAVRTSAPVTVDGARTRLEMLDISFDDADFPMIGADFERDVREVLTGRLGNAPCRLMRQRPLVDYGAQWMARHRNWPVVA
jgi:aminoglycoside 3-N-acetyltransferase